MQTWNESCSVQRMIRRRAENFAKKLQTLLLQLHRRSFVSSEVQHLSIWDPWNEGRLDVQNLSSAPVLKAINTSLLRFIQADCSQTVMQLGTNDCLKETSSFRGCLGFGKLTPVSAKKKGPYVWFSNPDVTKHHKWQCKRLQDGMSTCAVTPRPLTNRMRNLQRNLE